MGIIHKGIPQDLALRMMDKYNLRYFVETGTHVGNTALWASQYFEHVLTIESVPEYFDMARNQLPTNVTRILGRSQIELELIRKINGLCLIWLDAHWSRDLVGKKPEILCPVLVEIEHIRADSRRHVIMVDDARLFTGTKGWPTTKLIVTELSFDGRQVSTVDDVFVSEPCPL